LREEPIVRLVPMIFSAAQSHPELLPLVLGRVQTVILPPLHAYFQHQAELGNIRPIVPLLAIQQFLGPVVFRAIATILAPNNVPFLLVSDEEFISGLVQTFLDGVRIRK
jgi:hypothetical protein